MNNVNLLMIIGTACTSLVAYVIVALLLGAFLSAGDEYMLPTAAWMLGGIMYAATVSYLIAV